MENKDTQEINRIMAFSDGVFAIIITLLIFEIKLPSSSNLVSEQELLTMIMNLAPKLICYAATFIVIGIYWTGHHAIFRHVIRYNRSLIWINNLFLMCVCFMPFPTSILGTYYYTKVAVVIYGLSLIATGLALCALWRYVSNNYRLINNNLSPEVIAIAYKRIMIAPLAALVSISLSFFNTQISLWIYVFAGLFYLLPSRIDRLKN